MLNQRPNRRKLLHEANGLLRTAGFRIQYNPDYHEFKVVWLNCHDRSNHGYFTDDLTDAVNTALSMHESGSQCCSQEGGKC